ncbi:hypothetical protein [Nakamurella sp.]|uniref:hypothetical protein n=1 Tax=Nakamurella sp. TaxID=1869182 RepID=UPI003B3BB0A0
MKQGRMLDGPVVAGRTSARDRLTAGSWRSRVRLLVDDLIDRVHHEYPAAYAVLTLPSGERMYVASHDAARPGCSAGHAGFFAERIRPFHGPAAVPGRGSSDLRPLLLDVPLDLATRRVLRYRLDLRAGDVAVVVR